MAKQNNKWTIEEEEALRAGVEEHGLSNSKVIMSDPQFASSLVNRSNVDLKDKWQNPSVNWDRSNSREKVRNPRRDYLMHPYPHSSKKRNKGRSKKRIIEELSDSEDYNNSCIITPQRRGTHSNVVNQVRKLNCEEVHSYVEKDYLMHPPPHSSKKRSKEVVEELSDSEDYHSDSEECYNPCIFTHQRRGTRSNMVNQTRKLNSEKVHSYLESLWVSFPEDKESSFTHLDPLWYTLYSDDSNKEKVLSWIKKKDIFSRKYVVFPIVQWGHWCVLIFCHFGESLGSKLKTPCILLLDSLAKADHSKQLEPVIRKFVLDIYNSLERTEDNRLLRKMPFLVPKVPQQRDGEECGFFVLYYIKLFVESAPESFSITNGYPYFMKEDWFNSEGLDSFCKTLDHHTCG